MNIAELTAKHADRGLTFERGGPFGAVPVQAFGTIDGLRFYFRFRYDRASLEAGPYEHELEVALRLRDAQVRIDHLERDLQQLFLNPDMDEMDRRWLEVMHGRPIAPPSEGEANFLPTRVTMHASISDVTGEEYGGVLDEDEFTALFDRLLDQLNEVGEEQQITKGTIDYLTRGGLWPIAA